MAEPTRDELRVQSSEDRKSRSDTKNDTKSNLILSALELFAENGIDAVSMRTINNAAGTRNASAVHYHFGNKLGIIEAIIQFIREELDTYRMDAVVNLERRAANGDNPSCREILWAVFTPYYRLYCHPEFGKSALKFLARLQIDMSPDIQAVLNKEPQKLALRSTHAGARATCAGNRHPPLCGICISGT
ncbi:MAG: TetR/AcrR family transcriptional regulator [Gammaproteobacteria bacterium]|nr:TetR/AcrR family transcriptional regulator [Gammaproteobacteria bacterium]